MEYDFESLVDRRTTSSMKWNVSENELPMWVADMDFKTAPEIIDALEQRVKHGIYGYSEVNEAWENAYITWWKENHSFSIEKEWLVFCTGVVPAISSIVRKLTTANENVVLQTPVYNIFFNSIVNSGRRVLESPLVYEGGEYRIDFSDLEKKLADPQTSLMILCNPHNPTGNIWSAEDLKIIGQLCHKYHVVVVSDEIHCDLTEPGFEYVPFASVSEQCRRNSVTCIAPTKSFNIAGLQTAAVMIPEENLRHKVWRALNTDEVAEPNAFAVGATIAAFTKGKPWLNALREYVFENRRFAAEYLNREVPEVRLVPSHATYLLWMDCSAITSLTEEMLQFIRRESGLLLSEGSQYGEAGNAFVRMNIACPRKSLEDGLQRFSNGIKKYKNKKV